MPSLSIVATPIGNLSDITFRAVETLRNADVVVCEDTRVTRKLLAHYGITTPVESFHAHSDERKIQRIVGMLREGKKVALVSDAGTPLISDPGNVLIDAVQRAISDVHITPIPGPSALTACLSVSPFSVDKFLFLGFLPRKNKRIKTFAAIKESTVPVAFYESPQRIEKTMQQLVALYNEEPQKDFSLIVAKELTKLHETILYSTKETICADLGHIAVKGEFVVVLKNI